jgi:prefoldin subunit 5
VETLVTEVRALRVENEALRAEVAELRIENRELRTHIDTLIGGDGT